MQNGVTQLVVDNDQAVGGIRGSPVDLETQALCCTQIVSLGDSDRVVPVASLDAYRFDIADRVGASREMVARILKDLTIGEYIRFEGRHIVINTRLPAKY